MQLVRMTPFLGGFAGAVAKIAVFVCGIGTFLIGANVFRLRSIPPWARERLRFKPGVVSYGVGLVGGLLLMVAAIAL